MKRGWNLAPVPEIVQKIPENYCSCQLAKFGDLMSCGPKDILKMHPVLGTDTHHDVTGLVNHGMVKNTKT